MCLGDNTNGSSLFSNYYFFVAINQETMNSLLIKNSNIYKEKKSENQQMNFGELQLVFVELPRVGGLLVHVFKFVIYV